jgi:hypothetical protein
MEMQMVCIVAKLLAVRWDSGMEFLSEFLLVAYLALPSVETLVAKKANSKVDKKAGLMATVEE